MKTIRIMTLCLATILVLAGAARAQTTFYVRGVGGSDANNGQSWATAFATLQKGLDQLASSVSNLALNVQASTGSQAYYVGNRSSMGSVARLYQINIQGGWTDVDGTPAQTGLSVVTDNNGPIDQPGLTIQGAPTHATPRTVTVNRLNFTNVTHGIYMAVSPSLNTCDQILNVSNCTITAENHGIFMDYLGAYKWSDATQRRFSALRMTGSTIAAGRSGVSGDGIRLNSNFPWLDLAADVTISSLSGVNIYQHEIVLADIMTNAFRGTFGTAVGGYDLTRYGRSAAAVFNEPSVFTNKVALYGGLVRAVAQSAGRPLGTGITELNGPAAVQVDTVAGIDALFSPIVARKGQSVLWINGVNGGTWTADALTRENRAVLLAGGNGGVNNQFLITTNDRLKLATAPTVINGMVAPYFLQPSGDFLSYNSTFGLTGVTYTVNNAINSATATDLVYCDNVQTMTNNCFAYALWLRNSSTTSITNNSGGPYLLTLGSGGLSASHSATHVSTISPNLKFGTTGEKEALIFAGRDYYHGTLILQGSLTTTNGLTKSGFGTLKLEGDSSATLSGPVTINSGILQLNHANALPSGLSMNLQAGLRRSLLTGNNIPLSGGNLDLYGNNLTVADLTLADQTWVRNSAATTTSTLTVNGDITVNGNEYVATIAPDAGASLTLALGSANRTFQVVNASDDLDLSISAVVTGTGGLTKTGPGRMELRTNNTFSGSIIVKEGTLTSQSLGATSLCSPLGNSANAINLTNSATLMFAATTAGILHGAQTSVGRVSVAGGNVITFANNYNSKTTNTFAALERAGSTRGTLLFQGGNNGSLRDYPGLCVFIYLTETPTITNGMLPPWIAGRTTRNAILASAEPEFLTYDATLGIKSVAYDVNNNFGTAVQKVNLYTAPINVTANKSMWALRTSVNITQSGGAWTLAIGSGGLLFGGGVVSIAPSVQFGATGTDEAVIFVDTGTAGMLSNTVVTTGGLTKFGAGTLSLAAASTAFSGPVYVQAGILALGHNSALGTGSDTIYLQSGARLDYYVNGTLTRPVVGVGSITTGTNLLTVAATGSLTPAAGEIGTMYVEDVDFRGTYNWEYNEAGSDLIKAVNLTFGGSPTLNVTWLGGGNAPLGEYEVFRYVGAAPSLAGWTVATPSGQQGTLTLDTTNKRVLLTLSNSTSGTLLIFR